MRLFVCHQVYALYAFLLLSAFNRFPLRLPNRQTAGRKHRGDTAAASVTFADVAGVDEAKEELQEIVVCFNYIAGCFFSRHTDLNPRTLPLLPLRMHV
jgi:ATP-dependent Zn protease